MQPDLAALVGSRICHDLISPIGAINNGVELLMLSQGTVTEEMSLITQSVESAAARIKFFRVAYGGATAKQNISSAEVRSILDALSEGGRVRYDWRIDDDMPRNLARCVFLMIQALETALPLGGVISVTAEEGKVALVGKGRRFAFEEQLWNGLSNPDNMPNPTAALVQFALLPCVLSELGRPPTVTYEADTLKVVF